MIIYKVTNNINGKIYIGQTTGSLSARWKAHCHVSSRCVALYNAIKKYGVENFTVEQIDSAMAKWELDLKEQFWIQHYNSIVPNGYNLKTGGNTPTYSDESKKRMSTNHADVRGKNNPRYGVHLSKETRKKISDSHLGKRLSAKHKEKCRLNSHTRKLVKNLDTGDVYLSCRLAEQQCGFSHGAVSVVCRGKGKTAGGYHWCYVERSDIDVKCQIISPSD